MASLKSQLDAAGYDVSGLDEAAVLKQLDAAGYDVSQFKSRSIAEQNLAAMEGKGPIDELNEIWQPVRAGWTGLTSSLFNGVQKGAEEEERVLNDEKPKTTSGKVGNFIADMASPLNTAINAATGEALMVTGIGPWLTRILGAWSKSAALAAVGKIKALAAALNIANLDALGQFLLSPLKLGGRTFEPIVQATSNPAEMLSQAQTINTAAGKVIGQIGENMDSYVRGAGDAAAALDLTGLKAQVEVLKREAVGGWKELGADVARKFDKMLEDLTAFITEQEASPTKTAFSELADMKTKLGKLAKFGSQTESNLALQQVYHAISDTLGQAVQKLGTPAAEEFVQANQVYHQTKAIIEGLEGRTVDAKDLFSGSVMGALSATSGVLAGAATHNPLAMAAGAVAPFVGKVVGKAISNYAPQVIARGLGAAAPVVGNLATLAARTTPIAANAIARGLAADRQ